MSSLFTKRVCLATSAKPQAIRSKRSRSSFGLESLEGRQFFSVTGFSLINQASFPGAGTTVTNQPTVFQTTLQKSWGQLTDGQLKVSGQTMSQLIAAGIQKSEASQGLSAYDIASSFDSTPTYNGTLIQKSSGDVLQLTFDAIGNQTTFTSTTNTIFGSYADPTFHVTYNLDLKIDLSLPSNLASGKVTATASATTSDVTVSTSNVLVGIADVFGNNIPLQIAEGINGKQENLSSIVPTGLLNTAFQAEAAEGYTHLHSSLSSGGNLVLTAQKPTLTIDGGANDHISISTGSKNSVVVTAGGKTQTFDAGFLKTITVNDNGFGKNTVDIPSLPSGITVDVNDSNHNTDSVTVGGTGSLAGVAGTVSVSTSSATTNLTVNDSNDSSASDLTVTNKAVEFKSRDVVTYTGPAILTIETGSHGSSLTVKSTASGVPTSIQTEKGSNNKIAIDGSSSAVTVSGLGGTTTIGNGSLASIGGTVLVNNFGNVVIYDEDDTVSRTVDLTGSSGGIFESSTVAFQGLSTIQLGYVSGVSINDGNPDNTFDAISSVSKDFFTVDGHFGDTLIGPAAAEVDFIEMIRPIHPIGHVVLP